MTKKVHFLKKDKKLSVEEYQELLKEVLPDFIVFIVNGKEVKSKINKDTFLTEYLLNGRIEIPVSIGQQIKKAKREKLIINACLALDIPVPN